MSDNVLSDGYGYSLKPAFFASVSGLSELKKALDKTKNLGFRYRVFGSLHNVILADSKSDLAVLKLQGGIFSRINIQKDILEVGSGVTVRELLKFCIKNSLSGFEFLAGMPSTVGGAVVGNAGSFGKEISGHLIRVDCLDKESNLLTLDKSSIVFKYRGSDLKNFIVIRSYFIVKRGDKNRIKKNMRECFIKRILSQDMLHSSCGCFFKNGTGYKAGALIDSSGLKGRTRGSAAISDKHANFLVNSDNSCADDILSLKDIIQRKIWRQHRIWLDPEVEIVW
ncbi:MAG: UDP-N-acetylmuramate dehydrogenase [Candidatus Omnitrophica bacterium]|nr:UDP-N-acetylmuramate dehydrogenase [Candidatus Omnitrophota bacterium]